MGHVWGVAGVGALAGQRMARVPVSSARAGLSPGSPNEASLEPESEDEAGGAQGSVAGTGRHRASTAAHVCWCRQSSVSRADHSAAVEVRLSTGAPALIPPCGSTQLAAAPLSMQPGLPGPWAHPQNRRGPGWGVSRQRASSQGPTGQEGTWVPLCHLFQPQGQRCRAPA